MIYCGIFVSKSFIEITALSGEYIYLDSERFDYNDCMHIYVWIDSLRCMVNEKCIYIFNDDISYEFFIKKFSAFKPIGPYDEIYFVNHKKVINMILFIYQLYWETDNPLCIDINQAFILASAFRLFDLKDISHLKTSFERNY